MRTDYHMHLERDSHTEKCRYNVERIALYARQARARGTDEIGITEHCNRFEAFRPVMQHLLEPKHTFGDGESILGWLERSFREDLHAYVDALLEARSAGLPVRASIEVDYLPGFESQTKAILDALPFDYILGSIHFLDDWAIDASASHGWPDVDVDEAYTRYFNALQSAAKSGLFDILAHPDLVKKFGHRPSFPLDEFYDACARAAAEGGVAIEINTAGLHKPVGEMYPSKALLERFFDRGVPLSLGSDAHQPEDVSRDHDKAVALAREVGYTTIITFDRRRPSFQPIS